MITFDTEKYRYAYFNLLILLESKFYFYIKTFEIETSISQKLEFVIRLISS